LIATAVTVPFMVIVAFVLVSVSGGSGSGTASDSAPARPLPVLSASVPPHATAELAPCTKVLEQLPVSLKALPPRSVHTTPDTPLVVAWGDPAIVLSCGVDRPKSLKPGDSTPFVAGGELSGPYYDVTRHGDANVWTTVDRGPYIAITIPSKYQGGDYIPLLSTPIAKALPAVCSTDPQVPDPAKLCSRRP
jgi:uncharacterized protein DUF3515